MAPRAIVIVLDGVGVGALPDAAAYGDEGSDTLGHVAAARAAADPDPGRPRPGARRRRCPGCRVRPPPGRRGAGWPSASPGKDSVTGHWELTGLVLEQPFPTFPHGFPAAARRRLRRPHRPAGPRQRRRLGHGHHRCAGRSSISRPASRSSTPRPTASSRSPRTKPSCRSISSMPGAASPTSWRSRGLGLGRVIARPFVGTPGAYVRTANRHDFAMPPPRETLLDRLTRRRSAGHRGGEGRRPLRRARHQLVAPDRERRRGARRAGSEARRRDAAGCCSSTWSTSTRLRPPQRRRGFAANLERFDARLARSSPASRRRPARDHRRSRQRPGDAEHRPLARVRAAAGAGAALTRGVDLGTRDTFADLGQTLAEWFGVAPLAHGTSFLAALR